MSLNKSAEFIKPASLLFISLFLHISRVLDHCLCSERPLLFYSKVVESSESRFRCIKCKCPPISTEEPRLKPGSGLRNQSHVTGRTGGGFLGGAEGLEHS